MRVTITGTVQGVGFRPAVYRAAERVGASGSVWNDGSSVVIDTDRGEELLGSLMSDLPPLASVRSVVREDVPYTGGKGFSIIHSSGEGSGASIPADSAVCDRCVREIFSPGRRHMYPFTTCTDCGPRFTLLKGMPYDRPLTSMDAFPTCHECGREFSDPSDRRFHHQTICCPVCGPSYRLELQDGTVVDGDPMANLARMLDDGKRAVVKGWGGMHICCNLDVIGEMREWYGRRYKPFAVMARDMDALRRYADPTPEEERRLTSPNRPIVLVRKRDTPETEMASPGLDNIGIFLPYTGMHHLLFSHLEHDALVMTSANVPGEPMVTDDGKAKELNAAGEYSPLAIETSGHAALRENYFLDDGAYLVTRILVSLAQLAKEGKDIGDLIADLPEPAEAAEVRLGFTTLGKQDFKNNGNFAIRELQLRVPDLPGMTLAAENFEGVRINFDKDHGDGWALVRMSLHEPIMPINFESNSKGGCCVIANELIALLAPYTGDIDLTNLQNYAGTSH